MLLCTCVLFSNILICFCVSIFAFIDLVWGKSFSVTILYQGQSCSTGTQVGYCEIGLPSDNRMQQIQACLPLKCTICKKYFQPRSNVWYEQTLRPLPLAAFLAIWAIRFLPNASPTTTSLVLSYSFSFFYLLLGTHFFQLAEAPAIGM